MNRNRNMFFPTPLLVHSIHMQYGVHFGVQAYWIRSDKIKIKKKVDLGLGWSHPNFIQARRIED